MASNCENSWSRPWSTQEIINNASNWSLAGDAGLLKYLETFSENLLSKAEETNINLNKLVEDLNSTSLSLDVIKNEFCSLHNIQFVESRVYEEDETLPVDQLVDNVKDTKLDEDERTCDMKEAVLRGIEVVDKYFDKVEVPASDSEDETDFPSFVLRPKDPYLERPLPYIIGSEDWHKKWHVGLLDSSSESETDKVSEKFSDSDSESDLPVQDRSQFKGVSNSGSEPDLSNRRNINPVANSTFDESIKQADIFGSSDSEDYNSVPAQAPISNRSFARELAAKLGDVIEQNTQVIEPEVNKRPIQSATVVPSRTIGNIFSDEPPPIDDLDDTMFESNKAQQGVFSGSGGLFDDLENSSNLWSEKKDQGKGNVKVPKSKLPDLFDDEDDIFSTSSSHTKSNVIAEHVSQSVTSKKISGGLFDDDSSEDDLFNEGTKHQPLNKPFLQPVSKPTVPFFDDEPPELEPKSASTEGNVKSKKPIGGVKIFGGTDLFKEQKIGGLLKIRRQESSESSDKDENINPNKTTHASASRVSDKSNDLFSDFDKSIIDKQNGDKTAEIDVTKDNNTSKEIVVNKMSEADVKSEKETKQLSLFDDDDRIDDDNGGLFGDDLFSNISTKKFTSSLFEEEPLKNDLFSTPNAGESSKSSNADKQKHQAPINEKSSELFSDDMPAVKKTTKADEGSKQVQNDAEKPKAANLFHADEDDETDDLFSTNALTKPLEDPAVPVAAPRNLRRETTDKTLPEISEPSKVDIDQKFDLGSENNESNRMQNIEKDVQDNLSKSAHRSVSINFFDQNPPDDDADDWDTKSENNLFEENDPILFDNTPEISGQRSGLFDNEPPSLFYESSGIVRDVSARVETDDSFNPYASSSRRFSSDIFNEQQSNDSFFMTKNKSHLESQAISTLGNIQEILNPDVERISYSNIDITPSGNIDDLLTDSVSVSAESRQARSDFVENSQNDNTKNRRNSDKLFEKPHLEDSFDSGLFTPSQKVTKIDTSQISQKNIEKTESNASATTNIKPPVATKPNSSLTIKDVSSDNTGANLQDSVTPKIGSPGKLKHNLNINVSALMPGVSLPKKKDMEKSRSFEGASSNEDSVKQSTSPSFTTSKSSEELTEVNDSHKSPEKSVNYENSSGLPEILPSITKDRVRIPVKRRPSTRKARKESIRNSVADFTINTASEPDSKNEEKDSKADETLDVSHPTEDISEKNTDRREQEKHGGNVEEPPFHLFSDDENVFSTRIKETTEKETPKKDFTFKSDEQLDKPLFDSIETDSSLFTENVNNKITTEAGKATSAGNMQNINDDVSDEQSKSSIFGKERRSVINSDSFESADFKNSDLFDDSEEFDDIFSTKKLPPKSNILKKSLFDDELDDDDIFGPSTSTEKNTTAKNTSGSKAPQKKSTKITQVRKLENTKAVEDPLSSFND